MARIVFPHALAGLVGGVRELELDVRDVRELMRALDARFPGFAAETLGRISIAIDGEIHSDPFLESIEPASEVHFVPRIQGG